MGIRRIAALGAAGVLGSLGLSGITATPAAADVAEVGGGAAGLVAIVEAQDYTLMDDLTGEPNADTLKLTISEPRVRLPRRGSGPRTEVLVGADAAGVSTGAIRVTTRGNLQGTPYAESSAGVADVVVPGLDVSGVRASCRWDEAHGATATTSIVKANGTVYTPEPNTVIELPGIGRVHLNEQFLETFEGRGVISVHALRLDLNPVSIDHDFLPDPYSGDDLDLYNDVVVGFASCDPLRIPPISGLKVITGAA
jgi:hypothetical protein